MNPISGLAIYFIIWWLVLFVVLPFGVRSATEAGETVQRGNEPGAPVRPMIFQKAVITTLVATLIFGVFYAAVTRGWMSLDALPFYDGMPDPNA
jgi:predicted secreted protein